MAHGPHSLDTLAKFAELLPQPPGGRGNFPQIADCVATLLKVDTCVILLFRPGPPGPAESPEIVAHSEIPTTAKRERTLSLHQQIASHVAASGKALLIEHLERSPLLPPSLHPAPFPGGLLASPIQAEGKILGSLQATSLTAGRIFREEDLLLLSTVALAIGQALQPTGCRGCPGHPLLSLAEAGRRPLPGPTRTIADQDLAKAAKVVAKTFYRELTKAGFGPEHIIQAATEIVSLLCERTRKHRQRHSRSTEKNR